MVAKIHLIKIRADSKTDAMNKAKDRQIDGLPSVPVSAKKSKDGIYIVKLRRDRRFMR